MGGSKIWRLTQIDEQAQLRFLRLRDSFLAARVCIYYQYKLSMYIFLIFIYMCTLSLSLAQSLHLFQVSRLIYTNSEDKILSLSSNAVHKIWKWANGKVTSALNFTLYTFIVSLSRAHLILILFATFRQLLMFSQHNGNLKKKTYWLTK